MRPTRKNTLGQTPKLSYAPCDKPLSSQASLRVLFPESILGVFLLFVVVVMYKRIGMSNESILHTTSAALLPLLFKPFAVSMAGVCTSATQQLALASSWPLSFCSQWPTASKTPLQISNISRFFHWQFPSVSSATRDPFALSTPQLQQLTLRGENAPSPTKLLYSPLWAALLCSRAFWRSTLDNPEHHGPYRASSWPFSCFLFPCTVTSAPYATGAPRHATSTHFSPQNLLLRLWPTN